MLQLRFLSIFTMTILVGSFSECFGYRILGIFPLHMRSHMMMFEQLMKGLARRGHQFHDVLQDNFLHVTVLMLGNDVCDEGLSQPVVQRLIKSPPMDPPYDVVIIEILTAHCFMGFGYHLKVPVIGLSPSFLPPWVVDILANPPNLAFVSNIGPNYNKNMNFWNRLKNVVHTAYNKVYFNYQTRVQTDLIKQNFGSDAPNVRELEQDLALVLINSHSSITGVKPITPAHVE
ncbi:hypothetical protein PV326_000580, partial [Microctonus aethiopoides]